MSDLPYFRRLARYNSWANRRIFGAVGQLDAADWQAPRSGFFGSLQKTLNHILVADRIWLGRFEGREHGMHGLDQLLHPEFAALQQARVAEDARIERHLEELPTGQLKDELAYRNMAGEAKRTPRDLALAHFFNHQTHHRGQAHAMLAGTAVPPPPLDLLYFLPEDRG
jgi:uncharacterized damage-inducible protein DinB